MSEGLSLTLDGPLEPVAKVAAFPSHPESFKPNRLGGGDLEKDANPTLCLLHWVIIWAAARQWDGRPMVASQGEVPKRRAGAQDTGPPARREGQTKAGFIRKSTVFAALSQQQSFTYLAAQGKSLTLTGSQPCLSGGRRGELWWPQLTSTFHSPFHPLGC